MNDRTLAYFPSWGAAYRTVAILAATALAVVLFGFWDVLEPLQRNAALFGGAALLLSCLWNAGGLSERCAIRFCTVILGIGAVWVLL